MWLFIMADQQHNEKCCISAFKRGNKLMAEQLLPRIPLPAVCTITIMFKLPSYIVVCSMVTLLHLAAFWGWGDVVTALVSVYYCATNSKDSEGKIPLHYAAYNGHVEVVKYFTTELQCDPMEKDYTGWTPLHFACRNGHSNIAQYLIREKHCNPSCETTDGWTPLHCACRRGHLNVARYLIREEHCNPSCEDIDGSTPLHLACVHNHAHIVQYLLSTGRVNPLPKDKYGITALAYASQHYDIIKLFEPFEECRTAFPVHTFTKLILTGDSGAGKTTTAKHLVHLASTASSNVPVDCVANVERYTAGIVPHHIQSEQLGNFVVYDFAGQQEYYSSHAAVLEQVMRRSAAMFVYLIDLRRSNESICQSVHYWLSFIDNACSTAEGRSHVLIVGSHANQVTSSVEEKSSLLQTIIATRRIKRQEYVGCIAMDCHRPSTDASRRLITILANSQKAITASQPVIHYYSHVVYAFLRTKLTVVGCILHDLVSTIGKENDSSLPSDQPVLTEILATLSDKGLILFIHHPHSSWVVVKTIALLNEINGTLFAPRQFKEHRDILASNTGIVSTSSLLSVFPHHNMDMLVGFLQSLHFCRRVEPSVLENTNLLTTPSHSTADLLFFPGLVQSERPDSLIQQRALEFGWCLGVWILSNSLVLASFISSSSLLLIDSHNLCNAKLLQLFVVSNVGALSGRMASPGQTLTTSQHSLSFLTTIDVCWWPCRAARTDQWSMPSFVAHSLVWFSHRLHQEHSPQVEVCECLISPNLIQRYPLDSLPDSDLFYIQDIAVSILQRKPSILSQDECCIGRLPTQSLPLEPYYLLSPSSVCELFNTSKAGQPVSATLLCEVQKHFCLQLREKPLLYKELRDHLEKLSLFTGRSPLVSCSAAVL